MSDNPTFTSEDRVWMRRALRIASKGYTHPNPMVGCVIVRDGGKIAEGFHPIAGQPHAEVFALRQAGELARGATAYVSLEPCSHYGRTPPCSLALMQSGIRRVVVAMIDPNPKVSGRGVEVLRKAGIHVDVGLCESESRKLNEAFLHFQVNRKPFVILKCAMTLDGKIATRTGDSKWITSESTRGLVHKLRAQAGAILCGAETVLADDPMLTARPESQYPRQPLRIVLDSHLRIPMQSSLIRTADQTPLIIAVTAPVNDEKVRILQDKGVKILPLDADNTGRVSLPALLRELGEREVTSLLVEGGAQVHSSFLSSQIANKIMLFVGAKIVGGTDAPSWVGGAGVERMKDAITLKKLEVKTLKEDILLEGYP